MKEQERVSLAAIADQAAQAEYEALFNDWARAQATYRHVRIMGSLAAPALSRKSELELKDAKRRLAAWAKANRMNHTGED